MSEIFTAFDSEVLTAPTGLVAGVPVDLAVSSTVSNTSGLASLRCVIRYDDLAPDVSGSTFSIGAVVESQAGNNSPWTTVGYQFEPVRRSSQGGERTILIGPNLVVVDVGIDDIVYPNDRVTGRISRQQGKIGNNFRVRLILVENDPGGANAFQSVRVTATGERF